MARFTAVSNAPSSTDWDCSAFTSYCNDTKAKFAYRKGRYNAEPENEKLEKNRTKMQPCI